MNKNVGICQMVSIERASLGQHICRITNISRNTQTTQMAGKLVEFTFSADVAFVKSI